MDRIGVRFAESAQGWFPVLEAPGVPGRSIVLPSPIAANYLRGGSHAGCYDRVEQTDGVTSVGWHAWTARGADLAVRDAWQVVDARRVRLTRHVETHQHALPLAGKDDGDGVQLRLQLRLAAPDPERWRFFAPARLYDPVAPAAHPDGRTSFMDDRLAYPLLLGYDAGTRVAVAVCRAVTATVAHPPRRLRGERRYLQETDLGALGFSFDAQGRLALDLYWPYHEGDQSAALDAALTPVSAYYPFDASSRALTLSYEIVVLDAADFASAAFAAFRHATSLAAPAPAALPFSLEDAIAYRIASLKQTYREWDPDGAAFFCSFDPTRGYGTPPSGFGTQFNTIPSGEYQRILEYGFTGRQLNAAYVLAERCGGAWVARGRRLVGCFVRRCATPGGWLYSLYDVEEQRPLYSVGESRDALLHYGGYSERPGNFLRAMVESASDLLLNYQWHRAHASVEPRWLDACRAFGRFLVRHQNGDGSWYRAYGPDGEPILGDRWFGTEERAAKSSTMIPIAYLVALGEEDLEDGRSFLEAARRAGDYVLAEHVARDHYQGATLDNPNVVDKEAALYTVSALLALHDHFRDPAYLQGAERAARLAVTWNYLWDPPFFPGTRLNRLGFKATGWGGINAIWGGGVVDVYSLFFLRDFLRLSELTGEPFYREVAHLIAAGTQQLLSHPGDLLGYAGVGMQPEGVGITSQGLDEGLIAKGDTWGSLGWIYLAGTFGLEQYLRALRMAPETRRHSADIDRKD